MDVEFLKQYLLQTSNSFEPWISRKEIASWSAIVLYLSLFLVLLNNIKTVVKHKKITVTFMCLFTILITIFIHQQFGSMVDSLAFQRAINKYIYQVIETDSIPQNFDYKISENQFAPNSILNEINIQRKAIRNHNILERIALPYIFKLIKDSSTVETEEGILYNFIIFSFFTMILIICKYKSSIDQIEIINKRNK